MRLRYPERMTEEEDEIVRQSKIVGIVYDPPQKGFPHLAAIFVHGKMVLCEPVCSIDEAEAFIAGVAPEIPALIEQVREKARRRKPAGHGSVTGTSRGETANPQFTMIIKDGDAVVTSTLGGWGCVLPPITR